MPENLQQTPWSDKVQQAITMIDGGITNISRRRNRLKGGLNLT